ncbi:Leucine-rich melanocyte differentiation-associated protein [Geodia barretti]|uniref:Leucine-rich melanocyte differentiation-associated protein n=1 Tax=Geodia barretti TaxID=519541 RepID=A0AA35QYT1_GEOBA|nr:Leucine-rich melanocyte differentiation-associated protein [Geodia barretti]
MTSSGRARSLLPVSLETAPNYLSLAYRELTEIPREVSAGLASVEILDLSHNNISDLRCLSGLDRLTTLNLDSNRLDSHAKFPSLLNLRVLWVNRNDVTNLSLFVENLAVSCPRLSHLSMMNNAAAPSYFNGGSRQEYYDYRHYVISHWPHLGYLDDTAVGQDERAESQKIYGRRRAKVSSISYSGVPPHVREGRGRGGRERHCV